MFECRKNQWGGKREYSGRKKTCLSRKPFNRRIDECVLKILKEYASKNNITETEALESAIILQSNIYKKKTGGTMKIVIPTAEGKLCGHFGHCESFTFVEINDETKEILNMEEKVPEEGISCQSASWVSAQGANIILAGGMGGRPMGIFAQNGIEVICGCPELAVKEVVEKFMNKSLETGNNQCQGEHHHCHHSEHGCHH